MTKLQFVRCCPTFCPAHFEPRPAYHSPELGFPAFGPASSMNDGALGQVEAEILQELRRRSWTVGQLEFLKVLELG